jgi:hypothetical protein
MQEEIENKTVNVAITMTKLTARGIVWGMQKAVVYLGKRHASKRASGPHGKQTVKQLIGHSQGVTTIDIAKTDIRGFGRIAWKYGIDYAIRKDPGSDPPKYVVFFKAKDSDAMTAAFREYTAGVLGKEKRPSVIVKLRELVEKARAMPHRVLEREKERSR